jgi:hypothetical protein
MDTNGIILTTSCAAALGISAGLTIKLAPAFMAGRRDWSSLRTAPDVTSQKETIHPINVRMPGRIRKSSIVGFFHESIRHMDGSFTRAYHVELSPSLFSDDHLIETRCNALARVLAARKPMGTILQFRLSVDLDPGRAITLHDMARDQINVHSEARILHEAGIEKYQEMAALGCFRQSKLTLWVRVPNPHQRIEDQFLPTLKSELREGGLRRFPSAFLTSWRASSAEKIVRRLVEEEGAAFEEAEKTFRLIERECPVKLIPFSREELWAAAYMGHRRNATSFPALPADGTDLREYLCGETIEASDNYILHGACPAAIVSLFTPPQPTLTADALRLLSINHSLNFRHTIVSEFLYPDQRQAIKRLDRRLGQVGRSAQSLTGRRKFSPEARAALEDLVNLRQDLAGGREALAQMRFFVVIYGQPARTRASLEASLKELDRRCEQVISEIRKISGCDADREEPAALRVLYEKALVGECDAGRTYREITETTHSLAALIPTESEWEGAPRPHTLFSLPTGKLIGIDLFDRQLIPSPLILALAAPRGGKSVLIGRLISDVLATKSHASVRAVDFGESFGPLVDVLGGRHLRFEPGADRTINAWDYDGLERGESPDEIQVGFVVGDLMQLARVSPHDTLAEDILITLVNEVYRNEVPRNRPGFPKHEPLISHLVDQLATWPFKSAAANRAEELKLALGQYVGHSFLDAPTHPNFAGISSFDVYELDSLEQFPDRVRESLVYRAAARVLRAIGKLNEDGTRSPTLLVFDEVWKIKEKYPRILEVIKRGARTGGKENVVTILATQAYEDLSTLPDIAKTAGVKLIGKQIGDYSALIADSGLSLQAAAAVSVIHNIPGFHAQFLLTLGSGEDKIVEMIQCDLSPTELWTFTTNPDERNARARVHSRRTDWSLAQVISWLALHYPQGLTGAGLVAIEESLLD